MAAFDQNGQILLFEWPVRNGIPVMSIKLHDKAITQACISKGSILVTVSEDQLLISNMRFLIPASTIFGSQVRNKVLNKLKQIYDAPGTKLLIKLPVTRYDPVFVFENMIKNNQKSEEQNQILQQLVSNMSQVWNYTDFRVNNIKDLIRQRRRKLENLLLRARAQAEQILTPVKAQNAQIELELSQIE